jgi:predicted nucleic acid-binding protein
VGSYYVDSSALVKRYVEEAGSRWVRALMAPAAGNTFLLARVTGVEVVSALVRHVPALTAPGLARGIGKFQWHLRRRFRWPPR